MAPWWGGFGIDIITGVIETGKDVATSEGGKSSGVAGTVATMYAALTTSVEGITFLDDPVGFVEAVVFQLIESTIYYVVGSIALTIEGLFDKLIETGSGIGAAIADPFGTVGGVITDLLGDLAGLIAGAAASAGPLAIPVSVVLWAVVTVGAVGALYGLWELYKLIRTVVV